MSADETDPQDQGLDVPEEPTESAEPGPVRTALDEALLQVPEDPFPSVRVMVELAKRTADVVDAADPIEDPRLVLSASNRLQSLCGILGLSMALPGGGGEGDGSGDDGSGGDPVDRELADIMGSGPEVRNGKNA